MLMTRNLYIMTLFSMFCGAMTAAPLARCKEYQAALFQKGVHVSISFLREGPAWAGEQPVMFLRAVNQSTNVLSLPEVAPSDGIHIEIQAPLSEMQADGSSKIKYSSTTIRYPSESYSGCAPRMRQLFPGEDTLFALKEDGPAPWLGGRRLFYYAIRGRELQPRRIVVSVGASEIWIDKNVVFPKVVSAQELVTPASGRMDSNDRGSYYLLKLETEEEVAISLSGAPIHPSGEFAESLRLGRFDMLSQAFAEGTGRPYLILKRWRKAEAPNVQFDGPKGDYARGSIRVGEQRVSVESLWREFEQQIALRGKARQ
jgi:hypothetical protein